MKPMNERTLEALKRVYQLPTPHDVNEAVAGALVRRGLVVNAVRPGESRCALKDLRLTQDGFRICRALFGPIAAHDRGAHMNDANDLRLYYVVLWDFELDESGATERDGAVFSDIEAAKYEARAKFAEELNYSFSPRVRSTWSRRLSGPGSVVGEVEVRVVATHDLVEAFQGALVGGGEVVAE